MAKQQNVAARGLGLIGMLVPLLYFGGLIYYFSGVGGGTLAGIIDIGLGPTVFGLAAIGLLFAFKPLLTLFRFMVAMTTGVGTGQVAAKSVARSEAAEADDGFDADDAIARYLAKRQSGEIDVQPEAVAPHPSAAQPVRPAFGRKLG